jgi:MFS family permease
VVAANTATIVLTQLVVLRMVSGSRRTRAIAALCGCWAACWGLTLAGGRLGSGTAAAGIFALAMVTFGLGETLLSPTLAPIVNDLAPEDLRGRYNGVSTLAWTTGFMVGPAVAGLALARGLAVELFVGLMGACVVSAALAVRLERVLPSAVNVVREEEEDAPVVEAVSTEGSLVSSPERP